jgi:DNA repair protein RecN (Recombination protein N)
MLSTNPSEELRPIEKVASGGEATRIALALKALWADREGVPILVLDESDIGIGGETAHKVAAKFKEVAKSHQLIVVSHLAQVAAVADRHFRVEKIESARDAVISVNEISGREREGELARMLGGSRDPQSSIALAKSLLAIQQSEKSMRNKRT